MQKDEQDQGFHFGPYHITGHNGPVLYRKRPLAVLWTLVSRAGHLVSKEELLNAVWPETIVSEGVFTNAVGELRRALGDNAKTPRYLETVHRRGYRFLEKVVSSQQSVVSRQKEARGWGLETSPFPSQTPSLKPLVSSLVGRDAELAQLHQLFEKVLHGERQLVFVVGEAGIGKTAVVEAFRQSLETRDWGLAERQKAKGKKQKAKVGARNLGLGAGPASQVPSL
jgi:DNA-binding winged helix-turn-helix (wHTH) protein